MPVVRYEFVAAGQETVKAAFRSITAEAQANARAAVAAQRETSRVASTVGRQSSARRSVGVDEERSAKRVADARIREERRAADYVARIRERHFRDAQRAEEKYEREALRRRERAEREALQNRAIGERLAERNAQRAAVRAQRESVSFGGLAGTAGRFVGGLATGAAVAAIGAGVAATRDAMRVQELANRVSINARKSGQAFIDPTILRREWEATARAVPGQTAEGIGGAVQSYITMTGDIETARRGQGTFATVASATGSNVGDIAQVAASLSQHFDVKGLEEMRDVLASLTFQGKEGAFELRDAASMYQRLAASAASFGVEKSAAGVKMLGGLTQIARTGTGSAEQATTAIENMFTQFKFKAPKIQAAGVDVYRDGKVRPIEQLIPEVIAKVGGTDIAKKQSGLTQIFGEQGIRALNPLIAKYNATFQNTPGSKEDKLAAAFNVVRFEIDKAANAAGTWADIQRDAAAAQQDGSAKIVAAWEEVVANAADDVVPHLGQLGDALLGLADESQLVTQGLGFLADKLGAGLKEIGIGKEKTPEQMRQEAATALSTFDATHKYDETGAPTPLTPAQIVERTKLVDKLRLATNAAWQPAAAQGFATFEDFDKMLGDEAQTGMSRAQRQEVYTRTITDPEAAVRDLERFPFLVPDAAEAPIRQLAEQATAAKLTGGAVAAPQPIDTTGVNKTLGDFGVAVKAASDALSMIQRNGRPDLLGGNGPLI